MSGASEAREIVGPHDLVGQSVREGRYAISRLLGEGAQGATLEAIDKLDGTLVAIKRFQVRGARSWKDVELAEREARVLGRLAHPLLPRAIDHFEEGGALYLVMERIEGQSLARAPTRRRGEVVRLLHDMDEVLRYLGAQSPPVIHRDIKPGNIVRRPPDPALDETRERYVLVDFGSVRDSLKPAGGSTVVGTFGYMAPEQFQGRAQPVSDIYGVGATALSMLTGQQPEAMPHRGLAIDVRAALAQRGMGPPLGEPLVRALEAMLEPDPDQRATAIGPLIEGIEEDDEPAGGSPRRTRHDRRGRSRKRRRREARRQARRQERSERRTRPRRAAHRAGEAATEWVTLLRALYAPAVMAALAIARLAVALATRVVVPVLFSLLAIVFGPALRRAGRRVAAAGARADDALLAARQHALGRSEQDHGDDAEAGAQRLRVEDDVPSPRSAEDDIERAAEAEEEALEEAIDEIPSARERKP